ncbi:uncharacterized protein MELLADRAFT_123832 [Melampsora larici-populina 98AG31]|uniref:Secreted protein n=1 Tax=Melampsora larici-populina (strain 98AG31 / pathotype 3-4-7) TaxID=747676 RepID=F4RUM7_MELLP|nr:uncharacterized protein MELLADRAFT_123832 [Melampsora larici-populina 98AG31]EGG03959.1 secreted protein [Melampsora larici-populina 98AG31]
MYNTMSFKTHLNIFVMYITLSFLMEINSVSGLDCPAGFNKGDPAACAQTIAGYGTYNCPYARCGHAGHKWIWMYNCVLYGSDQTGVSNQQCEEYNYLSDGIFTCWNHHSILYTCPHKVTDTSISCEGCSLN